MWHCYIWHVFDFFWAKQVTHPNMLLNTMRHEMLLVCEIWSWTRAAIWLEELFISGSLINVTYCTVPYFPHCVISLSHLVLSSVHMCVLTVLATSVSCLFCLDMFSLFFLSRLSCHPLLSLQSQGKLYDCEKVRNHRHVCAVVLLLHASSCRTCCRECGRAFSAQLMFEKHGVLNHKTSQAVCVTQRRTTVRVHLWAIWEGTLSVFSSYDYSWCISV